MNECHCTVTKSFPTKTCLNFNKAGSNQKLWRFCYAFKARILAFVPQIAISWKTLHKFTYYFCTTKIQLLKSNADKGIFCYSNFRKELRFSAVRSDTFQNGKLITNPPSNANAKFIHQLYKRLWDQMSIVRQTKGREKSIRLYQPILLLKIRKFNQCSMLKYFLINVS